MNLLPPDDIHALYPSRYTYFLSQPNSYRFLVAITSKNETTHSGDIAGFLVGARPKLESFEEDEWNPVFPEDAPVEKLAWFLGLMKSMKGDKMKYFKNDMWGSLSSSYKTFPVPHLHPPESPTHIALTPNRTRSSRNITLLPASRSLYVRASRSGRGLYEKLGCVNKGEHSVDVSDHGWRQPIVNTNMIRAAKGT